MKIEIRRNNYFQSDEWKNENPNKPNLVEPIPAKSTPNIELLTSYPPKYRINGQIVLVPKGMTPEEYYKRYMEGNFYEKDKEPNLSDFAEKSEGLHPLRKQYLENRLQELDYLERQQSHQDAFTTRLYGKKDLSKEREKIKEELYYPARETDTVPINKDSKESFRSNKDSSLDPKTAPEKEIPEAIQQAINDYKQAHPQEYQQERQRIDREKASAGAFKTQTLEEWQQKDKEYQDNKKSHCNTAIGSLLKEKGIDWPANKEMNDIIDYMDKSSEWEKIPRQEDGRLDHKTANDLAAAGETVVVTQKNPAGHGHSALLTGNSEMSTSQNWVDEEGESIPIPEVKGSVGSNPIKSQHLGWHLTQKVEDQMDYYRHKEMKF